MIHMAGILSIISTPIGNLEDITYRAVRTLGEADVLACEDTRVTKKLLQRYDIKPKRIVSLHQHSDTQTLVKLIGDVLDGKRVAYVSDAGTPNVNDPGGKLAEAAFHASVAIEIIPGPSALTAAIAACGFPMERFSYIGFLPQKKHRSSVIEAMVERTEPTVFFESTHRIRKSLNELAQTLEPDRQVYMGRELTKAFETHYRGPIADVISALERGSEKGEFVIVIGPKP